MSFRPSLHQFAPVIASLPLKALSLTICVVLFLFASHASAQASPQYGDCGVTTVGTPAFGPNSLTDEYGGQLNGFLPFPSDFVSSANISAAALDPNSAALITDLNSVSSNVLHPLFGAAPPDSGIPYYITDSSVNPNKILPLMTGDGLGEGEEMVIPYPNNDAMPIEGDSPDCSIWPDTDSGDQHSLLLDRNGCWIYEMWVTSRCPGSDLNMYYNANSVTLYDAQNFNARPWGFTSADAGGMSVYANTIKYDEAASGEITHAIRFTVPTSEGPSYFVIPGTHGASSSTLANKLPEGAVLRLNPAKLTTTLTAAGKSLSGFSTINQTIITALENYGMVMADNGGNMYLIGDNDPRWNDNDLSNLKAILASDFDVVQMTPEYPGMTESTSASTYYPDTSPTLAISSFTATVGVGSPQTGTVSVPAGSSVTFNFCVTGTNWNESFSGTTAQPYVYIDMVGPARLTGGCGSLTTTPTVTQTYTLYALNSQVNAINDGMPPFGTINLVVTGAPTTPAAVVFVPPPTWINGKNLGYTYAGDSLAVTPVTSTWAPLSCGGTAPASCTTDNYWGYPNATYYYTTATGTSTTLPVTQPTGTTPTTASTKLSTSTQPSSITVTKSAGTVGDYGYETVCAIATVPAISTSYGSANPSANSCATYVFTGTSTSYADAPIILPPSGTYNTPQFISIAAASPDQSSKAAGYNAIFYTTNGTTPTTASGGANFSSPPASPTMIFAGGQENSCYGSTPGCNSTRIYVTNGMTIEAIAASKTVVSTVTTNTYTITAATPTYSPTAGTYTTTQEVTISSASPGASIYYTTDGSAPTTASTEYSSAVTVAGAVTLNAIATCSGCGNSAVGTASYITSANTPTFSPAAGSYGLAQTVTISDTTLSSTIYYTTDGSTPTTGSSTYSTPITVSASQTLSAIATAAGLTNSPVASAVYSIGGAAVTPTFSPVAGSYSGAQTVTISDASNGASIYYTTNGSTPTTGSTAYSAAISVSTSQTLEVIAAGGGYTTSTVGTAIYTIAAATPTFSPAAGSYSSAQTVTISSTTPSASIYYTTNGSTPTTGSSVYTTPINVSTTETLEAIATHAGDANSAVGSAAYAIVAATPTFSPVAGSYTDVESITISDTSPGVTIYYTTGGTTPTTGSSVYQGAIVLGTNATTTIEAIAAGGSFSPSGVMSGTYTISGLTGTANIPTFSPTQNSTYTGTQTVTISDGSAGVSFYYTLTPGTIGVAPTTNSPVYTGPITIAQTSVLEAFAEGGKYPAGSTRSGTYTIVAVAPTFSPVAGSYSSVQTVTLSTTTPGATIYYTTNGSTPTSGSATYSSAITVSATETLKAIAEGTNLNNSTVGSAVYTISAATPTFSPGAGSYSSSQSVTISDATGGATIHYTTDGTTPTTASSTYSSAITVSADETLEAIATATGDTNSAVGSAAYTIAADTPTFNPGTGNYTSVQTVTISDATGGASIYYTTNGTTPSTASTPYSAPITVSSTETLEAIATASSYGTSAVGSAVYTLQLPQTISFTPSSPVTYGISPITLSATGGGSGNPVTFSYVSGPGTLSGTNNDILTITGVGTVNVTANQAGNSNFAAATPVPASIVVNPAVLTVTANNLSKAVGAANPTLTVSYSGFQYSDGTGVLSGAPALSTTATTASGPGIYPITVTQGTLSAANYTFAFVNGTLSVIAAPTVVITTTATVTGSHSGGYSVAVTVTNSGTGSASNVTLTSATLGTTNGTPLPQSVATLGAGDSYTFTVSVAGSAGLDGAGVAEKYSGTYTGGSFSASVRSVTLP